MQMDYTAALAKLKGLDLEGKDELISAIEGRVSALESKNYEVIGEKRTATTKAQSLQTALEAIAKAVGVEGDIDSILDSTQAKVAGIAAKVGELESAKKTLETTLADAQGKVQTFERKGKLQELATAAGANLAVLERLFGDQIDDLKVAEDGGVLLGEKPLKDAVEADPELKAFSPALFVSSSTPPESPKPGPKLPGGGPAPKPPADPVIAYVNKAYGGAKALGLGNTANN